MQCEDVTFTWSESDPGQPARAVLLRLIALTDFAYDDGNLAPYLMRRGPDGAWSLTLRLPSTLRSSYQFCPVRDASLAGQLERDELTEDGWAQVMALGEPDPLRPPTFTAGTVYGNPAQPPSLVELSEALPQPWSARRPGVSYANLTRHELGSSVVHVHQPPGAEQLAIVFDAGFWLAADIGAVLDNLQADQAVQATMTVAVESIHGARRHLGLTHPELFEPFLVDELLPWLRTEWSMAGPAVLYGQSLGGLTVCWAGLRHPTLFDRVITSSMAAWWPGDGQGGLSGAQVVAAYGHADPAPLRFFLEVGGNERELLSSVRDFHDVLCRRSYEVRYREYDGGHDIACWRGGLADGLIALSS